MNNKKTTNIICYLDEGDVWGFVCVCSDSGMGGGRHIYLVDHLMEILPLLGGHLPACLHNITLLLSLVAAVGGIHHLN